MSWATARMALVKLAFSFKMEEGLHDFVISEKKVTSSGDPLTGIAWSERLEEEARRQLHLAIRLRASDLAEAGRGGEGCQRRHFGIRGNRKGTAWRLEVCVVNDVEGIDAELEVQRFMYLEVLR